MRAFAQETPRKGGVFNVHYGAEQRQLNPSIQASTGVYIIGGKIQEPLVDLDANGESVGVLAESWEASPDGKTWVFRGNEDFAKKDVLGDDMPTPTDLIAESSRWAQREIKPRSVGGIDAGGGLAGADRSAAATDASRRVFG